MMQFFIMIVIVTLPANSPACCFARQTSEIPQSQIATPADQSHSKQEKEKESAEAIISRLNNSLSIQAHYKERKKLIQQQGIRLNGNQLARLSINPLEDAVRNDDVPWATKLIHQRRMPFPAEGVSDVVIQLPSMCDIPLLGLARSVAMADLLYKKRPEAFWQTIHDHKNVLLFRVVKGIHYSPDLIPYYIGLSKEGDSTLLHPDDIFRTGTTPLLEIAIHYARPAYASYSDTNALAPRAAQLLIEQGASEIQKYYEPVGLDWHRCRGKDFMEIVQERIKSIYSSDEEKKKMEELYATAQAALKKREESGKLHKKVLGTSNNNSDSAKKE